MRVQARGTHRPTMTPNNARNLRNPDHEGAIRLDWLAILAGRPLPALERALADLNPHQTSHGQRWRPQPTDVNGHKVSKPALFTAIRRDAHDHGLSIRTLADRYGVHRRTVLQALDSPVPAPRKRLPPRRSRLEPFKDAIDAMLRADLSAPRKGRHTVKRIFDRLTTEHGMTDVSYSTVQIYVALQRPPRRKQRA